MQYGKHGKPFMLPGMQWNAVVLPPSNAAWIARQPDSILSGTTTLDDLMGLHYISHGPSAESCRDFTVIRRDLTRNFMGLSAEVGEEVRDAFEEELAHIGKGEGERWEEVKLQKVIMAVAFRAANRIFVGVPMCKSKPYKAAVDRWMGAFGISMMMVRFVVPRGLSGLFLRVAAMFTKVLERRAGRFFVGRIRERLTRRARGEGEGGLEKQNDMMQWIIEQNASKNDPRELEPRNIAGKMILFNIFGKQNNHLHEATSSPSYQRQRQPASKPAQHSPPSYPPHSPHPSSLNSKPKPWKSCL